MHVHVYEMKYYTKISLKNIQAKFLSNLESLVHIDGGATEERLLYSISLKTGPTCSCVTLNFFSPLNWNEGTKISVCSFHQETCIMTLGTKSKKIMRINLFQNHNKNIAIL
jgi:hypothetical protein